MEKEFKVRTIIPTVSNWFSVTAENYVDAIQTVHAENTPPQFFPSILYGNNKQDGGRELVLFARFEVDGIQGSYISRMYWSQIWRSGGVRPPYQDMTIQDVAEQLKYTGKPEELLEPWDNEEENWT